MILMFGEIPEGVENINIVWCVNLFQQISNKTLNFPSTIKKIRINVVEGGINPNYYLLKVLENLPPTLEVLEIGQTNARSPVETTKDILENRLKIPFGCELKFIDFQY